MFLLLLEFNVIGFKLLDIGLFGAIRGVSPGVLVGEGEEDACGHEGEESDENELDFHENIFINIVDKLNIIYCLRKRPIISGNEVCEIFIQPIINGEKRTEVTLF